MPHKLLLADDSVTIQRVIELTFADEDVHVVAVGDGKKAIASIQADRPDIVLADVGMPERDGYEVAAFVKGNAQYAHIPVLLLTGAFEPIDETRARAVGCDGVLVKPFEPQMVINRVKDLLAGRRPSGLWSNNQSGKKTTADAPAQAEPEAAPPPAPVAASSASASLEDYFDRLDAAFASVEAATELHSPPAAAPASSEAFGGPAAVAAQSAKSSASASASSMDPLAGWDPDLAGDPQKPPVAVAATAAAAPAVSPVITHPPTPVPAEERRGAPPQPPTAPAVRTPIAFKSPVSTPVTTAPPIPAVPPQREQQPAISPAPVAPAPSVAAPSEPSMPTSAPTGGAARAAYEPPAPSPAPTPVHVPEPASASAAESPRAAAAVGVPMPSLAEAFATLLAAEQGRSFAPSSVGQASVPVSDDTVDEIVGRVIARMTDQSVRDTVLSVAERLVREEIDRIKGRQSD